ncbi:Fc.00g095610.m01.CDS01 [Cosmosporella sp. VM-42]
MVKVTRAISVTNFMVASSALAFQVFVLYPWHKALDDGFEDLKKEHLKLLDAVGNNVSDQQRQNLSNRLNQLESRSSKRWWWL